MQQHPWRTLRDEFPEWSVVWEELPDEILGLTDYARREIVLDRRHLQGRRRTTLMHEIWHIRRGDTHACDRATERWIEQRVARDLIPVTRLVECAKWATCRDELAEDLWVDRQILDVRLAHLHPAEWSAMKHMVNSRAGQVCTHQCSGCAQ